MINLESKLANMQLEVDKIRAGHCLVAKIINYDELYAILGSVQAIIDDLNKMVRKICSQYSSQIFSQIDHNKIIVVLPEIDKKSLSKLVLDIYKTSQLYLNADLPSAYINCQIATIDFPTSSKSAPEMYTLLIGILSDCKSNGYYHPYDKNLHDLDTIKSSNNRLNLLRRACVQKTRTFAYQPIIDRKTASTPYYECLLRIPDENGELISVGPIIHDAENKGLINVIDFEVFQMAVEELVKSPETSLSVNISNYGVLDDNLLEMAEALLKKHKVAKRLIVEITETLLNENYERTKLFINRLHKFGCKFALDDFGSGFTSFQQLQNLPIDIIKIDGSYVRNIVSNHHSKYFVETLVKISEELGIKTVAEFVENGEIAKFLIDIKVDGMQGNFFSPASCHRN